MSRSAVHNALAPDDPVEAAAWAACLKWACGHPDVLARYWRATGDTFQPFLDASGEASEASLAYAERFAVWFNANVWGDFAPHLLTER